MYFQLFVGVLCFNLFCYALLCVGFDFAIILKRTGKLIALVLLSYRCIVTINVLWLFLTVPWVGLQYVNVVFLDQSHLLINEPLYLLLFLSENKSPSFLSFKLMGQNYH